MNRKEKFSPFSRKRGGGGSVNSRKGERCFFSSSPHEKPISLEGRLYILRLRVQSRGKGWLYQFKGEERVPLFSDKKERSIPSKGQREGGLIPFSSLEGRSFGELSRAMVSPPLYGKGKGASKDLKRKVAAPTTSKKKSQRGGGAHLPEGEEQPKRKERRGTPAPTLLFFSLPTFLSAKEGGGGGGGEESGVL